VSGWLALVAAIASAVAPPAPSGPAQEPQAASGRFETIGHSVQGRPIRAVRIGNPRAPIRVLVVGEIHGTEPAGRAVTRRLRRARPPRGVELRLVDRGGGDRALERLYARRSGLPYKAIPLPPGAATGWQNDTFPRDTAFVVELPAGSLRARAVRRHADAVLAVARAVAPPRVRQRPIPSAPSASARCVRTPAATTGSTTSGCAGRG